MIIAIVCDVLGKENNGTTIAAMNLIRHLKASGHTVRIVCPDSDKTGIPGYYIVSTLNLGPLNNYVKKNGVSLAINDRRVMAAALQGADAVHVMIPFTLGIAAAKYAASRNIPVTAGFHCQAENITNHLFLMNVQFVNNWTYRFMYRHFYRYVDAIHYPTAFIRDIFETIVGPTNGYIISNGVNIDFTRKQSERPAALKDKFMILFTGRYGREKSHKVLIDAVAILEDKYDIQLIFAGSGPLEKKLKKYSAKKLNSQPIMRFFSRKELVDVINYSDLYVHPAEIEIESIACLEAISCGLVPVISNSPRSAARYFALDERNQFECNNADDLAGKIEYWINNPEEKTICSNRYLEYAAKYEQGESMRQMENMITENVRKALS